MMAQIFNLFLRYIYYLDIFIFYMHPYLINTRCSHLLNFLIYDSIYGILCYSLIYITEFYVNLIIIYTQEIGPKQIFIAICTGHYKNYLLLEVIYYFILSLCSR